MISDQDTLDDDVAARRVRDLVARSQEAALSEVRDSRNSCQSVWLTACLPAFFPLTDIIVLTVYTTHLLCQ